MAETWLVTGAGGFLGRHVVEALATEPSVGRCLTLDRRRAAAEGGLIADLAARPPDLRSALARGETVDVVVHLAGLAHREADAAAHHRAHVDGTRHLLAAVAALEAPPRAILFASTVAVYGRIEGGLLSEQTPLDPTTAYGAAKADAEDLIGTWGARHEVAAVVLRLPLVVGREAPGNLGRMIEALAHHRYLGVGAGEARRSMVLAEDVAAFLPRASRGAGTYHLTDRRHPSFRELERAICAALGRRLPPRLPRPLARGLGRLGDLGSRLSEPLAGRRLPFTSETFERMTSTLTFSDVRAVRELGWTPGAVLERAERWVGASSS